MSPSRICPETETEGQFYLGYRPALDGLRGIAVLLVIVIHAGLANSGAAYVGVDIFFVLSGFLITSLLVEEFDRTGRIRFKHFYARRALRLLPALIVFLMVVTCGYWFLVPANVAAYNSWDALVALFYSTNWARAFDPRHPDLLAHTWTLSIEEQFYLLWPGLLLLLLKRTTSRASACYWLLLALFLIYAERILLYASGAKFQRLQFGTDTHADALVLGCLTALLLHSKPAPAGALARRLSRPAAWVGVGLLIFLAAYTNALFCGLEIFDSLVAIAAASFIFELVRSNEWVLNRLLASSWLVYIGKISYGLYLWHHPIFRVVQSFNWNRLQTVLTELAATALVTLASFYLIERPFLRMKRRFNPLSAAPSGSPISTPTKPPLLPTP